ncbi:MAG: family 20 glycosylhydrolase [Clostridia bacterium]|nr:family 20 glycosylhydrolase [Clostridia bacterium]MBP3650878.1 family 20 glycosylhydrolase [Clostridia bacterium]
MILLPRPQQMTFLEGSFSLSPEARLVLMPEARKALLCARQLQEEIRRFAGITLEILCGEARQGDIVLAIPGGTTEGYRLEITVESAALAGNDEAGLFYAVQTLRQIVRQSGAVLPALSITDAPLFPHRGFYHDATRGRTPTLAWLKHLVDEASYYKLNQLQLYVEHTYFFRDLTELWGAGEPLTAEEIMELDEYAFQHHVELVPSLSSFGHLFELLNTKSCCHLCELETAGKMESTMPYRMAHHTLNISDPESLLLIEGMLREFMPLFRSRQFNICADETFDLGKGRGREAMAAAGEGNYYIDFVSKLCRIVSDSGRTPMFWGDIVVQHPEALAKLPKNTVCLNWGYSPNVTEDAARLLAQAGAVQYVCPGVSGWNRMMNRIPDSYENIRRMAAYGRKYGAVGLLNTDWGDYGHINDPRFSLPGMIMGAQACWSDQELPFETICHDISRLTYLDTSGRTVSLLARLQGCDVCSWWHLVQYREHALGRADEGHGDVLASLDLSTVEEENRKVAAVAEELKAGAGYMDSSTRTMLHGWLVACEGIQVWNLIGAAVKAHRQDAALAERLERWLRQFEQQWRQVSKESELWRIREMVRWYAAKLRA